MIVRAFTAGTASAVASPARHRNFLAILNQSTTETLHVAFDTPAVAGAVAGQVTIGPLTSTGNQPDTPGAVFRGVESTPWQAIHIISSGAGTPVTILE